MQFNRNLALLDSRRCWGSDERRPYRPVLRLVMFQVVQSMTTTHQRYMQTDEGTTVYASTTLPGKNFTVNFSPQLLTVMYNMTIM